MTKKPRRFVPRAVLMIASTATVVPLCALEACGGSEDSGKQGQSTGGGPQGVAAAGFRGVAAGGFLGVGVSAFGGAGGRRGSGGVAAGGFGGAGGRRGSGGVAAGGFRGVAAGGFLGVAAGGFFGVAGGGFGGVPRDAGADAQGGHASRDPSRDGVFGELSPQSDGVSRSLRTGRRRRV